MVGQKEKGNEENRKRKAESRKQSRENAECRTSPADRGMPASVRAYNLHVFKQGQEKNKWVFRVYVGLCGLRRKAGQQDHAPTGVTEHKEKISPRRWIFKGGRVVGFWPSGCRTTRYTEKKGSTKDSIEGMPGG